MRVTIYDVALKAAVSKSTVSNVLNDHLGNVSPETAQRVHQAIHDLGYQPNRVARGLACRRTDVVGVVVASINRPPYPAAVQGIYDAFNKTGHSIILSCTENKPAKERALLQILNERQVDGIIIVSQSGSGENDYLIKLAKMGVRIVVINRLSSRIDGISTINIDNVSGTLQATQHLISLGHKRIAFFIVTNNNIATKATVQRQEGFCTAMQEAGLDSSMIYKDLYAPDGGYQFGYRTFHQLLQSLNVNRPTAVVCANDFIAFGVMAAARDHNLQLPADLAVTGHDNTVAAQFSLPSLTSVEQPMYDAGITAADMLCASLSGDSAPKNATLKCRLIVRNSSELENASISSMIC